MNGTPVKFYVGETFLNGICDIQGAVRRKMCRLKVCSLEECNQCLLDIFRSFWPNIKIKKWKDTLVHCLFR